MTALLAFLLGFTDPTPSASPVFEDPVRASMFLEHAAVCPGEATTVAVVLSLEPGWHVYYDGQNDSGMPVTVEFELPAGCKVGPLQWPAPSRHRAPGDLLDHVYETELVLLADLQVPKDAALSKSLVVRAKVSWFVCTSEECRQGDAALAADLEVPASALPEPRRSSQAERVARARAALPKPLSESDDGISVVWAEDGVAFVGTGVRGFAFFPHASATPFASLLAEGESEGERLGLSFRPKAPRPRRLAGILEVRGPVEGSVRRFRVERTEPAVPSHR